MTDIYDESITIGGRTVAVDDPIKVLRSTVIKTSFIGRVKGWWIKDGEVVTIDVWGGRVGHQRMRSLRLDQVEVLSTRMKNSIKRKASS